MSTAIAIRPEYTDEQLKLLKRTVAKDATDDELRLFGQVCQRTGLDPFAKQIYCIHRKNRETGQKTMGIQVAIDGYRLIAERTGKYAGQLGPFWCGKDGKWVDIWLSKEAPSAAKVGVVRSDFREPLWGIALWTAYAQSSPFWRPEGHGPGQIAKCAEALALRKAFPQELSGIHTHEEMEQAGSDAVEYIAPTGPNIPVPRKGQTEPSTIRQPPTQRPIAVEAERLDREYAAVVNGTLADKPEEPSLVRIIDDKWLEVEDAETGEVTREKRPTPTRFKRMQSLRTELKIDQARWEHGLKPYCVTSSTLLTADQTEHLIARLEKAMKTQEEVRGKAVALVQNVFPNATVIDDEEANKRAAAPTEGEQP